ncbi:MAG: hypothetical protein ACTHLN_14650 [Tepidisphaeraceae bacterium]
MYRAFIRLCSAAALCVIAGACVWWYRVSSADQRHVAELQQQKQELEHIVTRLSDEKRVADVIVTDQKKVGDRTYSRLLFVEYDRQGKPMKPRELEIAGENAHVEAKVIEFDRDFVMKGDPLRGHAISLFTRIFGDQQTPESAPLLDKPGDVPAFYRDADAKTSQFEQDLWKKFWQLESDKTLQEQSGVRVAVGKGVWGPFEPKMLYTLTLQADGNLSRHVEPIRGVYEAYIQMLRQSTAGLQP